MNKNKSPERVKEKNVRTVALLVVIISTLAILFKQPIIMLILSIDFFIRSLINSKFSILAILAKKLFAEKIPFREKIILMKPKKFAASIGAILSLAAGIFGLSGQIPIMIFITGVLLLFSIFEAFFKFCAGCWMFGVLIRLNIISDDNCLECSLTPVD